MKNSAPNHSGNAVSARPLGCIEWNFVFFKPEDGVTLLSGFLLQEGFPGYGLKNKFGVLQYSFALPNY